MVSNLAYTYKVRDCNIRYRHNWKYCPLYHEGEDERRRDPRVYNYQPIRCRDYHGRKGRCPRADACTFAHGYLEVVYHPDLFRTQYCWDGLKCMRVFCTFAHTVAQLRPLPSPPSSDPVVQHNLPLHDRVIRGVGINNRNTNDYNASPSSAAVASPSSARVVQPNLPLHDQIIRRPGINNRNTNDYYASSSSAAVASPASSSSAAVASPSSTCVMQPNLPLHDQIIRRPGINNRNTSDYNASPSSAAVASPSSACVVQPNLPLHDRIIRRLQIRNTNDYYASSSSAAVASPSSACVVQPNLLHDRIIRGPWNNRNTNDHDASSSSAAVAPQAMNRVHDHQTIRPPVVTFLPSAIPRENDDDRSTAGLH